MPNGNRTGPMGQGPKTGRGAGYCASNEALDHSSAGFGRRNSRRGIRNRFRAPFGRGRSWFDPAPTTTQEQK